MKKKALKIFQRLFYLTSLLVKSDVM